MGAGYKAGRKKAKGARERERESITSIVKGKISS